MWGRDGACVQYIGVKLILTCLVSGSQLLNQGKKETISFPILLGIPGNYR